MATCYKCSVQIKKYDDKNPKIQCKGCTREICGKCSELSATELRVFCLQNPKLSYLCADCQEGLKQVPMLRKLVSELKEQVMELKENQPTAVNVDVIIQEKVERENRSRNVILFGIEEANTSRQEDIKSHDKSQVLDALAQVPLQESELVTTIRLGKPIANKPRPLKVILRSRQNAIKILKTKSKLPSSISVKSDMTPYQREQLKKLRLELTERTNNGEKDLTIKYINGQPKIIITKSPKNH